MITRAAASLSRAHLPLLSSRINASHSLPRWTSLAPLQSFSSSSQRRGVQDDSDLEQDSPRPVSAQTSYTPETDTPTSDASKFMNIPPREDPLLNFMVGMLTVHGNRQRATRIVSRILLHIYALTRSPPLPILREALFAIAPFVNLVKVHTSQIKHVMKPQPLSERKSMHKAIRWLISEAEGPGPIRFEERVAREVIEIHKKTSSILLKKKALHDEAALNKANVFKSR